MVQTIAKQPIIDNITPTGRALNGSTSAVSRRYSVAAMLTSAFLAMFLLFILAMVNSYFRILDFKAILFNITEQSLPEAAKSKEILNQINSFLYLTNRLSSVRNRASLNIEQQKIEFALHKLRTQVANVDDNFYMSNQLQVLTNEFSDLRLLVSNKLELTDRLANQQHLFYQLHSNIIRLPTLSMVHLPTDHRNLSWLLTLSEITSLASRAFTSTRLQQVRQISFQITEKFTLLTEKASLDIERDVSRVQSMLAQLQGLLLAKDGLLELRVEQLQIIGRVIGRGNFVRNLVGDFILLAESKTYAIDQALATQMSESSAQVLMHTQVVKFISILVFLLLLLLALLIHSRIIKRIALLNALVQAKFLGQAFNGQVTGNDEVADIAKSFAYFANKVEEQQQILHSLAITDSLTGLPNRRGLDLRLTNELQIAKRNRWATAILMIDVDFFKNYNDVYGHLAGDECLKAIAEQLMKSKRRTSDFVSRYGGEEFVFILPNTDELGAELVAKQILAFIKQRKIVHQDNVVSPFVTLSIGIAVLEPNKRLTNEQLLEQADQALYLAKNSGRNQVCYHHQVPQT